MEVLSYCNKGITVRKFIVCQSEDEFQKGMYAEGEWKNSAEIYKKYKGNKSGFLVLLIILDGRIKMDQSEIIFCENFFSTIDSMPIRKAEMRKDKSKHESRNC